MPQLVRRLAFLLIAISACSRSERSPGARYRLRVAAIGPLAPLSPGLTAGFSTVINPLVFEPLVVPKRGETWHSEVLKEIKPSGHSRFRFRLKPHVTFSDGVPLSPQHLASLLPGAVVVSQSAQEIELDLSSSAVSAESRLLGVDVFRLATDGPVGTGPFTVAEEAADRILLQRRTPGSRRVDEVELISFPGPRDAFAAVMRGDANLLIMPSDGQLELLEGIRSLSVLRNRGLLSVTAVFNVARLDTKLRRAISAALTEPAIAMAYGSVCRPRHTREEVSSLPPGDPLQLVVFDGLLGLRTTALAIRRALSPRTSTIVPATVDETVRRGRSRDFDLMLIAAQTWPDESALGRWITGAEENWGGYSNPRFDEAFHAGDFARARAELEADPPAVFICDLERTAAVDSRITNATLGDYDMLDTLPEWEVAP